MSDSPHHAQADRPAVLDLTTRAFGRQDEAGIIEKLEKDGDVLLQLVAEMDGQVVGHILFYPIGVFGRLGAAGLGPMSVDPWVQREGIGSQLVMSRHADDEGCPACRSSSCSGTTDYYPRFGFSAEAAAEFETPLKGPHFMAMRMRFGPPMSGRLDLSRTRSGFRLPRYKLTIEYDGAGFSGWQRQENAPSVQTGGGDGGRSRWTARRCR